MPPSRVAVLGAGIAGLTAAYRLQSAGLHVDLYESQDRTGGVIKSDRVSDFLFENGPNSIQPDETARELISALDLSEEVVTASAVHRKRFVVRSGRPVPVPLGPREFLSSPLFSWPARLRLLKEPFVSRSRSDESVASFVRRRLGQEFLDYAINPFVAGVYAGDPEELSVQHSFPRMVELEHKYGSLIRAFVAIGRTARSAGKSPGGKEITSFRDGMETLPRRIAERLNPGPHLRTLVVGLESNEGTWRVRTEGASTAPESQTYDAILSTVPAHVLDEIGLPASFPNPDPPYPPLTAVGLGYDLSAVGHPLDGFGVLVPAVERSYRILGALFSSSIFPNRAPEGQTLITVFLGGTRHQHATYLSDERALRVAHADLVRLLHIRAEPVFTRMVHWARGIPQYNLHHDAVLRKIERIESEMPGLFLAGNYRGGISVVDTISNAHKAAGRTAEYVQRRSHASGDTAYS